MSVLQLDGVSKRFGALEAVRDVTLDFPGGAMITFLGPSGSGKSTLFRLVAGLEEVSEGRIRLMGRDVTNVPAHRRNVGMVFQSYALFPHLRVWENIAYGLSIRSVPKEQCRARAAELLALVKLPDIAERNVAQLSGGQRQRVAIARALALEPLLFLLDEPLSALDAKLRGHMQIELIQLQRKLGVTTIVVTHDQREAMAMSDIVAVLDRGAVQQVGSPLEIYRRPANAFVADFIGTSNLLTGVAMRDGTLHVRGQLLRARRPQWLNGEDTAVTACARPEDLVVVPGHIEGENGLFGTVSYIRDMGSEIEIYVDWDGEEIVCRSGGGATLGFSVDDDVTVRVPDTVHLMAADHD